MICISKSSSGVQGRLFISVHCWKSPLTPRKPGPLQSVHSAPRRETTPGQSTPAQLQRDFPMGKCSHFSADVTSYNMLNTCLSLSVSFSFKPNFLQTLILCLFTVHEDSAYSSPSARSLRSSRDH